MTDIPTDIGGVTYVVITEPGGPFERGELLVCAPLPGAGVREIGYPSRKPLKWDCEYKRFGSVQAAIDHRETMRATTRGWVPTSARVDAGVEPNVDVDAGGDTPPDIDDSETCEECTRVVDATITAGDRGGGPDVCLKCYLDPGWYREE